MKDIKKEAAVTADIIAKCHSLNKELGVLEEKITNRMTYALNFLFAAFDRKLDTWYFPDASEGGMGDMWHHFSDQSISVITEIDCRDRTKLGYPTFVIIDKDGDEWEFDGEFPTRWLFEDFENEIIEGKKKFEEKENLRKLKDKEKRQQQKEEDKKLAAEAKLKLSKRELAALRRTL